MSLSKATSNILFDKLLTKKLRETIKEKYFDRLGWIGFVLIVSAYLFLTIEVVNSDSIEYHLANFVGAACMCANAYHRKSNPLLWLNIVWFAVSIVGIWRAL